MGYSSMLFVFFFFALSLLTQVLLKTPKARNMAMLVFSLIFCGWSGLGGLILLVAATLVTWFFGLLIGSCLDLKKRKIYLGLSLVTILAMVLFFRYRGLFPSAGSPSGAASEILPPVGIAYYSLQMISYLVDVYRGEVRAQSKIWLLLTYTSLFHLVLGGPVVRYRDIRKDLLRRKTTRGLVDSGISRFSIGFAKLVILSQSLSGVASVLIPEDITVMGTQPALALWLGLAVYGLSVFFRISAYADMAIGMGLLCGLRYPEQFDDPFTASSVSEFWSRCMMTVTTFFADYIYAPLGNSEIKPWKDILATLSVWALVGLWVGPGWNYMLWGVYFGLLLVLERHALNGVREKMPNLVWHILTVVALWCSCILLWCEDLSVIPDLLKSLIGIGSGGVVSMALVRLILGYLPILILAIMSAAALGKWLRSVLKEKSQQNDFFVALDSLWEALHPVALLILSAMAIAGSTSNPFLFIQF